MPGFKRSGISGRIRRKILAKIRVVQVYNCGKTNEPCVEKINMLIESYNGNGIIGYEDGKDDFKLFIPYTSIRLISKKES